MKAVIKLIVLMGIMSAVAYAQSEKNYTANCNVNNPQNKICNYKGACVVKQGWNCDM